MSINPPNWKLKITAFFFGYLFGWKTYVPSFRQATGGSLSHLSRRWVGRPLDVSRPKRRHLSVVAAPLTKWTWKTGVIMFNSLHLHYVKIALTMENWWLVTSHMLSPIYTMDSHTIWWSFLAFKKHRISWICVSDTWKKIGQNIRKKMMVYPMGRITSSWTGQYP